MSQVVTSGPLRFRTRADLDLIRLAFIKRTPAYGLTLVSSSINGQSYQFQLGGHQYTEEEFGDILAAAYNQIGEYKYGTPTPDHALTRF